VDNRIAIEGTSSRNKAWLRMSWALICIGDKVEVEVSRRGEGSKS
jgi:hypothetical protein